MKKYMLLFCFLIIFLIAMQGCGGGSSNGHRYYIGGVDGVPQNSVSSISFATAVAAGVRRDQFIYSCPLLNSFSTYNLVLIDENENVVEDNNIVWSYDPTSADLVDVENGISYCKKVVPKHHGVYDIHATYNGQTVSTKLVLLPSYTLNNNDSIGIKLSTVETVLSDDQDADIIIQKNTSGLYMTFKYGGCVIPSENGTIDNLYLRQYQGEELNLTNHTIDNSSIFLLLFFKDKNGKIYTGVGNTKDFVYCPVPKN
ncbi:MAG: hypothetical protein Q8910_00465 [Bacteroidota bacterium]|nr:hypothetical protein [Bacteroidota bacterium]